MPALPTAVPRLSARPVNLIMIIATLVGLWFGFTAPDVSPVVGPALTGAVGAAALQDGGDGADEDGPGRDGGGGGPR